MILRLQFERKIQENAEFLERVIVADQKKTVKGQVRNEVKALRICLILS